MIIFKTVLTDKQIEDYKRPEGTKNYECGGGVNCAFCTLKMLGVYNPELEETSKTCGPRFRAGNMVKPAEYLGAVKRVIADMTDEHHEFVFDQEIGQPSVSLAKVAGYLGPQEACYFIYGRVGSGTHAVVLRKNLGGQVELIDPQRGSDDIGKEFGFTAARAAELGIELTPQYYRVRGIPAIEEVMIEQSVLFKYWGSKKELLEDIAHFTVACVMVDSVVGLKMLIDDHKDTSKMMDVEEMVVPNPNPQMDVEAESEMEMEGGGTETTKYPTTPEKGMSEDDDSTRLDVKRGELLDPTLMKKLFLSIQETATAKVDPVLFETILKLLGKAEGTDVITNLLELPEEEFEEEEEKEQMGGAAVMITPEEYKSQIREFWTTNQADDRVNSTFYLMKKALELHNVERNRISKKGILVGFESPNPTNQCKKVGRDAVGNICWLCGGFAPYKWENLKPETQMGICKLFFNRKECEHILPINLMYFLKTLVNTKVPPTTAIQTKLQSMLYDNSCRLCNGKKDNGLYIRTQRIDGDIEPHVPNILSDVLTFFTVYGSTTGPCESGNGNMGDVPSQLGRVGSLVHVKGKYYPNVIRAQLNPGFVYGTAPTIQSSQADKAVQLSGPGPILSGIQTKYPEAYEKLTSEPGITELTTSPFGGEVLPQVTTILKGKLHTASSLEGPFKEIARVDQKVAVDWILRRFCIIYDRMKAICNVLNSPEGKALWNTQTESILSGTGQPIQQIKVLAVRNNGPESERIRIERMTKGSVAEDSDEERRPAQPPAVKRRRKEREPSEQEDDVVVVEEGVSPPAKQARIERENSGQSEAAQYDDNELLNVERNPLDESFNYDELLKLPGYTNTRGGGGGEQHLDISVHRGGRRVVNVEI